MTRTGVSQLARSDFLKVTRAQDSMAESRGSVSSVKKEDNDGCPSSPSESSGRPPSTSEFETNDEEQDEENNEKIDYEEDIVMENAEETISQQLAEEISLHQLEPVSDDTDDEAEELIKRLSMSISHDERKLQFREAVKKSTLRRIESLIAESEELKSEARELRWVIVYVHGLLNEVESDELSLQDRVYWLESCRSLEHAQR